jgi:hypothetical protein
MKEKVDFKKLVRGDYYHFGLDLELEMINWLFKTGLEGKGYQERRGWYRSGVNQLLYGYSGNDEIYRYVPFPIYNAGYLRCFMNAIFTRAFLAPHSSPGFTKQIALWRERNKINIEKYRFFNLPEPSPNYPNDFLWKISAYRGKELKKRFFHPDFPNRTRPRIIAVTFSTCGEGYFVKIEFSFWEYGYKSGWTYNVASQNEGEYIGDFLKRVDARLKFYTAGAETDERTRFEKENNFIRFSERGCFNCIWYNHRSPHTCGCMEIRGIKNCSITNPKNHLCDEWEYNYSLTGKFPNEAVW